MLSVFFFSLNAILPILLLILLGFLLRQTGWFDQAFLAKANKFNFQFCLCAGMFCNAYSMQSLSDISWELSCFALVALLLITLLGVVTSHFVTKDPARRSPLVQNAFRSNNSIIGLPLSETLGGAAGLAMASALQTVAVLYFNVAAVLVFAFYMRDSQKPDMRGVLVSVLKNPLIQGLLAGTVCVGIRSLLPTGADGTAVFLLQRDLPFVYTTLRNLGQIGTPFALLILGGQFSFQAMGGVKKELAVGLLTRLVLAPLVGFGLLFAAVRCGLLTMSTGTAAALISLFATPTAVSSAVLAEQMGADEQLAGQLVVWTSIGSLVTLFVIVSAFRLSGIL